MGVLFNCIGLYFSFFQIMNLKAQSEASLNGITKDMHLHRGSLNGKLTKPSWDSSLPFPSKYFLSCMLYMCSFGGVAVVQCLVYRSLLTSNQSVYILQTVPTLCVALYVTDR